MFSTARLQRILPIIVLILGGVVARAILSTPSEPAVSPVKTELPLVTVLRVQPESVGVYVHSQGVVSPRLDLVLSPELAGKVVYLHKNFVVGGVFAKNDLLLALDSSDYDHALSQAEAHIAEAQQQLAVELAQAEQARSEWQTLNKAVKPSPLLLHIPQLAAARAKLKAAQADLALANINRRRCQWRAPFAGRIHAKQVGLGQYVPTGDNLARLDATDVAQIRLPIAVADLGLLALPLPGQQPATNLPTVKLTAELAGKSVTWLGHIVRTEGAVEESTGEIIAVAEVQHPYQVSGQAVPLWFGMFVQAEITGNTLGEVFVLPPAAVNAAQQVLVVDAQQQLHSRRVQVLRNEPERVLVSAGLTAGEQVVVSELPIAVEGMTVKISPAPVTP